MELNQRAIQYDVEAGVARITLAAPESGNSLGPVLLTNLIEAIRTAQADRTCWAIILSSQGSEFSRGIELSSLLDTEARPSMALLEQFVTCLLLLANSSRPVIARVCGQVLGGGVGLVAACDIVLAAEETTFMLPEAIVGMIPAVITPFLLRRLTLARVNSLTVSTRRLHATEAYHWGLVDEVCAAHTLDEVVKQRLRRLMRSSPQALESARQYFRSLEGETFQRQLGLSMAEAKRWLEQPDVLEGLEFITSGLAPSWFQSWQGQNNGRHRDDT